MELVDLVTYSLLYVPKRVIHVLDLVEEFCALVHLRRWVHSELTVIEGLLDGLIAHAEV